MADRTETGFRTGSIEVINAVDCGTHQGIIVKVGDATVDVFCSAAGKRATVTIRNGTKTRLRLTATGFPAEESIRG